MNLKTRHVIKGIGKQVTVRSVVNVFTTSDGQKMEKVEDRWDGQVVSVSITNVSMAQLLSPSGGCTTLVLGAFGLELHMGYLALACGLNNAACHNSSSISNRYARGRCDEIWADKDSYRHFGVSTLPPYRTSSAYRRTRRKMRKEATGTE